MHQRLIQTRFSSTHKVKSACMDLNLAATLSHYLYLASDSCKGLSCMTTSSFRDCTYVSIKTVVPQIPQSVVLNWKQPVGNCYSWAKKSSWAPTRCCLSGPTSTICPFRGKPSCLSNYGLLPSNPYTSLFPMLYTQQEDNHILNQVLISSSVPLSAPSLGLCCLSSLLFYTPLLHLLLCQAALLPFAISFPLRNDSLPFSFSTYGFQ